MRNEKQALVLIVSFVSAFVALKFSPHVFTILTWLSIAALMLSAFASIQRKMYPVTVFAACLAVTVFALSPALLIEEPNAAIQRAGAAGGPGDQCQKKWDCDNGCCEGGECLDKDDPRCGGLPPVEPPTISAELNCTAWGNGPWCIGALSVTLSASDPQGESVLIHGFRDDEEFACEQGATSCTIPLTTEGTGKVRYQVDSVSGSANGAVNYALDITSPEINGSLNGTMGLNDWYVSDVTVSASADDSLSGLATLEYSLDGGAWTMGLDPIADGVHTVNLRAFDKAGNVSETSISFQVDTITPSLDLAIAGTLGLNGIYNSTVTITATATDSGSGIATVETTVDGGAWTAGNALTLSDGTHSYQFRVTDNAGNFTETGTLEIVIDAAPPVIDLPETWNLGETAPYEVTDMNQISEIRIVIEDEDERFPKVVWDEDPSGTKFTGEIAWDGLWKDKSKVVPGEYPACVKASDTAGNESMKCGMIVVEAKFLGIALPPMKPSSVKPTPASVSSVPTAKPILPLIFGGNKSQAATQSAPPPVTQFSAPSTKSAVPPLTPQQQGNILWGAAAAASVGAWTAETQRKKKEKEEAARAARAAETAERSKAYSQIAKAYSASKAAFKAAVKNAQSLGMSKTEADQLLKDVTSQERADMYRETPEYQARQQALKDAQQAALREQSQQDQRAGERAELPSAPAPKKDVPWWQKAWNAVTTTASAVTTTVVNAIPAPVKTFAQEKIVEPVQKLAAPIITTASTVVTSITTPKTTKPGAPAKDDPPKWWEKLIEKGKEIVEASKEFVREKVIQPANKILADTKVKVEKITEAIKEFRADPIGQTKKLIAAAVTTGAEYLHTAYNQVSSFVEKHPKVIDFSNALIDPARKIIGHWVDTNPETMSWADMGMVWFFELGGEKQKEFNFGPNARTTQDLMDEEGIQQARQEAIQKILSGDLSNEKDCSQTVCNGWTYGQKGFWDGLLGGNTATSFTGSYNTTIDVVANPDGSYTLIYTVKNESGWASATRLRKAAEDDPEHVHQPIIPDKEKGSGLHLGGKITETWQWSETIPAPGGQP